MSLSLMLTALLVTSLIEIYCSYNFSASAQLPNREPWNSSAPIPRPNALNDEERRLFGKFLEQGEELFRRECYKNVNVGDDKDIERGLGEDFAEKFAESLAEEGILKQVCEDRINMFKNLNATLFANQSSNSSR